MKIIKIVATICILLTAILGHSQQSIVFEKTYRTETIDTVIMALTGAQTSDGGYLLGGYAAYGMYLAQMMFFKIDSVGNYEWKKMYGSLPCSSNMIYDMEPVGDGTFICCGEGTFSTEGEPNDLKPNNTMIMRVDENANIIWHKEFDAGWHECLYELALSDTGYMCVGYKEDYDKAPGHFLWINGDIEGNFSKLNTLDMGLGWQSLQGVSKMTDSSFVASGVGDSKSCNFLINTMGDTLITKIIGTGYPEDVEIYDIVKLHDDNLLYIGVYTSNFVDSMFIYAFRTICSQNLDGDVMYLFNSDNEIGRSVSRKIVLNNEQEIVICGTMKTSNREMELWVRLINQDNDIIWDRKIGGANNECVNDFILASDGGYLMIGESNSFNDYNSMYIVKIDSLGQGNYTNPVETFPKINNELVVFPNPARDKVCVQLPYNDKNYTIEIYDLSGRKVFNQTSVSNQYFIDVNNLENGIYLLKVNYNSESYQSKLIINH
jgi:hypothetical protein